MSRSSSRVRRWSFPRLGFDEDAKLPWLKSEHLELLISMLDRGLQHYPPGAGKLLAEQLRRYLLAPKVRAAIDSLDPCRPKDAARRYMALDYVITKERFKGTAAAQEVAERWRRRPSTVFAAFNEFGTEAESMRDALLRAAEKSRPGLSRAQVLDAIVADLNDQLAATPEK